MKQNIMHKERGQALVLIVFAAIGLFAFTALAIDGSAVFSDHRHAQNAADTAALAAALARVRDQDYVSAAQSRAESNGYKDNGSTIIVRVYLCNEAGATCTALPADITEADKAQYIQVKITSTVKTYFARVIGRSQVTHSVNSVARAIPPTNSSLYEGNAVVGLNPTECGAVFYNGSANVTITGTGIYTNSKSSCAFNNNSSSPHTLTAPCLSTVGGYNYTTGKVIMTNAGCPKSNQSPIPAPPLPNFDDACPNSTTQIANVLSAGTYNGGGNKTFPPAGVQYLAAGVYCVINADFRINGGDTLIGHDVTIYLRDGTVSWNGGATVQLDAPLTGPYAGLLLYLPPSNINPVTINGNGDSHIVGSIWAPSSTINVQGGGGSSGLQCQFVGDTVNLNGSSDTTIVYNAALTYKPPIPPTIKLNQ